MNTQEKLAEIIIKHKIDSVKVRPFLKSFDVDPSADLDELADKALGIETVTVPVSKIPKEVLDKINEEKEQFAKVQKIKNPRKKPSKPITKQQVKEKIPVEVFPNNSEVAQNIRVIKDNLARKSVDFRTKYRCYNELRRLYGLQQHEHLSTYERDEKGHVKSPIRSTDRIGMSHDDIAKEVGFSRKTMQRAKKIEESNLPEKIKDAAFNGRLSIYPVAEGCPSPRFAPETSSQDYHLVFLHL